MTLLERQRLERGVRHLHSLGVRATAELLAALVDRVGGGRALEELLEDYGRLSPTVVRQVGADSLPALRPRPVPPDLMHGAA